MILSFRLLIISSMYQGYLRDFYKKYPEVPEMDYENHYAALISDSTEFAASYTRAFSRNGVSSDCIIINDEILREKWSRENNVKVSGPEELILQRINSLRPDILWIEDLRFIRPDFLNEIRKKAGFIKLIAGYHCAPVSPVIIEKLRMLDLVVTCTPGLKSDFEKAGLKSYLVYHGFDTDLLAEINTLESFPMNDVVFTGSLIHGGGYHNERISLLENLLKRGINISLYVNTESNLRIFLKKVLYFANHLLKNLGIKSPEKLLKILHHGNFQVNFYPEIIRKHIKSPKFGIDMYQLLNSSKVVLNNHGDVAGSFAGNMRLFEATGAGTCLITDNKSNMPDLFDINNEVVVYDNADECAMKIRWLLDNDSERRRIALAGQRRTLKTHTVDNRCKTIIEILRAELNKKGLS